MANTATLMVRILGDASKAQAEMGRFAGAMNKAMVPATAVGAALVGVGLSAVKSASALQQAQGAVNAVFGKSAKVVESYASTSATRLGVSASEYMNSAALMGTALQNAGYSSQQAAKVSDQAWKRAADMAALYGGTGAEAMEAINAAVGRGEFEQLERYGVSLKMDSVNALLAAKGQDKLSGAAKRNAQAQAIMGEIMKQSGKAAGQFGRESNTVAVQQQKMAAQIEDSKAAIGTGLLPVMASLTGQLANVAGWVGKNSGAVTAMAGALAAAVVAVYAINAGIKVYQVSVAAAAIATNLWNNSTLILRARLIAMAVAEKAVAIATKAWSVAQLILNAAFWTSPITWIIVGIVALVAAIIYAWKNSDRFRAIVLRAWAAIRTASVAVFNFLAGFIRAVWNGIRTYFTVVFAIYRTIFTVGWQAIKAVALAVISWYRTYVRAVFNGIRAYFTTVFAIYKAIFTRSWAAIKSITRGAFNAARTYIINPMNAALAFVRSIPGKVSSGLSNLRSNAVGKVSGAFNAAKDSATTAMGNLVSMVKGIPGKAANALSGLGGRLVGIIQGINLYNAGAALISNLTSGIQSKIESAVSAVANGAKRIKDLWPGSPVKTGPLTAWNNGRAGKRLMEMLARGIEAGASDVERAAQMAAYGISGGLSLTATGGVSPSVNVSVPAPGPTVVEVHLDGQVIGRFVQKKVDASMSTQARRIVLGAVS